MYCLRIHKQNSALLYSEPGTTQPNEITLNSLFEHKSLSQKYTCLGACIEHS